LLAVLSSLLLLLSATAAPAIYPLSLHDALPICSFGPRQNSTPSCSKTPHPPEPGGTGEWAARRSARWRKSEDPRKTAVGESFTADRKSTRLNSSHVSISYAVFCLKKKNT